MNESTDMALSTVNDVIASASKNTLVSKASNGKEYKTPVNICDKTLSFLATTAVAGNKGKDDCAIQAVFDSVLSPEAMTEHILTATIISAQNRSNELYERALQASDSQVKAMYFKYASKFADRVAPLAEALAKQKQKSQKITVERINIESGAQAVVGNISNE